MERHSDLSQRLIGQEMFHILDKARRLEREGKAVCHLELGDPFSSAPEALLEAINCALRNHGWHYTSSGGEWVLKEEIANLLKKYFLCSVGPQAITIAPANYLITNFLSITCNPGDKLLLITPCFPSYIAVAKMLGLQIIECPTSAKNAYEIDESVIDQIRLYKPRAVIVNSANNPTGAVYSQEILDKAVWAAKEVGAWVLSDETYGLLSYANDFKTLLNNDYDRLVVLSSFSKIFSVPGLRLGYQVCRSEQYNALSEKYLSTTLSCMPPFIQLGCANFLADKELVQNVLDSICDHYALVTQEIFKKIPVLSQWICPPKSAFYLFVPLPQGVDGRQFSLALIEKAHVAVTPGISFGGDFNSFVRVATCGEESTVLKGIGLLASAIQEIQ